jgi:putative transposase
LANPGWGYTKIRDALRTGLGIEIGRTTVADGEWIKQVARNLTDSVDGFLRDAKYLIHDRDPLFTEAFETTLRERGVECVKIPAQSPNCNPYAERFVKTIKYECLNHLVLFGE